MKTFIFSTLLFQTLISFSQFAGSVGTLGTTAMYKDSSVFVNWASGCIVTRGKQDIAETPGLLTTVGSNIHGTQKAGENGVVSLGDGGQAILTFSLPITNGAGFDFAVFENAFNDSFLELAFVEVSSDGENFVRFPATSNTPTLTQIGNGDNGGDATKLNNLAGKYRGQYGTPFDLEELKEEEGLDINHITHIKIIDVVGSINPLYANYDKNSNVINEPYPTPFPSGGFDLDAIGVIHQAEAVGTGELNSLQQMIQVYPNPTTDVIFINYHAGLLSLVLTDVEGNVLLQTQHPKISLTHLCEGMYFLKITDSSGISITKKIIKN